MTTFVISIKREDQGIDKAKEIIEGLPIFEDLNGWFTRLIGHGQEERPTLLGQLKFGILAYEFNMDETEFHYLRLQIEETILSGSVSYFQRDIFGHLHQLA